MRAHVIENGIIINTVIVNDLNSLHDIISAEFGGNIGDSVNEEGFVSPAVEPEQLKIPYQVTMRQARLALLKRNLLDTIERTILDIDDEELRKEILIEWEYALDVRRDWPALNIIVNLLEWESSFIDELFIQASKL